VYYHILLRKEERHLMSLTSIFQANTYHSFPFCFSVTIKGLL